MQFLPKKRSRPTIDLSPLVDVVFLLIIFFTVSTTFREGTGLPITLPKAGSATVEPTAPVDVTVGSGGQVEVDGKVFPSVEAATDALRRALDGVNPRRVTIRGDKQVSYDTIVRVIDLARTLNAEGATLATKRESTAAAPAPDGP